MSLKTIVRRAARGLGWEVVSTKRMGDFSQGRNDLTFLMSHISSAFPKSAVRSQLGQDVFAITMSNFKKGGYFVEFGATNGVDLSNTYLLEKAFGWKGVLAEPAACWHDDLIKNRKAHIDKRCVWNESNRKIAFRVADLAEFSGAVDALARDRHQQKRESGHDEVVETITLSDLLDAHGAPSVIDYLSIDTEGSELAILQAHDFSRYRFNVITCEHNYTADREKIFQLLRSKGYSRVLTSISEWDDWYIFGETPA